MKKIYLNNQCSSSISGHLFELFVLPTLDIQYKCKNCNYEYLDIVDKPDWLIDQKEEILKNRNKENM